MRKLKRALTWCALLNKRFLKKPAFLVLLLLAPALTLTLRAAARLDGGILTVALCPGDAFSEELADTLTAEAGTLRYLLCEGPEEARALVSRGDADAAWIFSENSLRELQRHVEGHRAALVTVVEREDNVFLMLAREKLYAALFPSISREAYAQFLLRETGAETLPEDALDRYYDRMAMDREIIVRSYVDGSEAESGDYLLSPVRGLLSILVVLGGMAAGLFLVEDRQRGAFVWVRPGLDGPLSAGYLLLPMLDLSLAALAALLLSGSSVGAAYELLLMLLLAIAGAGFCGIVVQLCRTPERIGAAALLLTVCMLALCPIFLNVRQLRWASMLFPPYWYLHAAHNAAYAAALAVYALAVWLLNGLLFAGRTQRGKVG